MVSNKEVGREAVIFHETVRTKFNQNMVLTVVHDRRRVVLIGQNQDPRFCKLQVGRLLSLRTV